MKKIGITGGIGSGKTFVCKLIEKMSYPVFYSDLEAKKVMEFNPKLKHAIIELVGIKAYENEMLNKSFIANAIFSNKTLRKELNALVHPYVFETFENWCINQKSDIVFNESALLIETGSYMRFDGTILIYASNKLKIQRIQERDHLSKEEVQLRIQSQLSDKDKYEKVTYTIENNEKKLLIPQLNAIIEQIKMI